MGNLEGGPFRALLLDSFLLALRLSHMPGTCTVWSPAGADPNSV